MFIVQAGDVITDIAEYTLDQVNDLRDGAPITDPLTQLPITLRAPAVQKGSCYRAFTAACLR